MYYSIGLSLSCHDQKNPSGGGQQKARRIDPLNVASLTKMAERPRKKAKKTENSTPSSTKAAAPSSSSETNPLQFLNKEYLSTETAAKIAENFKKETPFSYASLADFLDGAFLDKVKVELLKKEEWNMKNNDLYTFTQTDDLKHTTQVRPTGCHLSPTQ